VLLQREIGCCRLRACALALSVTLAACGAFAGSAGAEVRHYERVSPADKGDGDIIGEGEAIVASKSGDGATFESRLVFGDAVGSGNVGRTTYLARRGGDGQWSTHAVTPMSRPEALQVLPASTKTEVFSNDLRRALTWGYDLPGASVATPDRMNLYVENTATRALATVGVSQVDQLSLFDFLQQGIWGVSDDLRHVAFASEVTPFGVTQFLPEAAPGVPNVYKWDDGVLSVAGVLPDGTVPTGGATVSPGGFHVGVRNTMSADGTRLAFVSTGDGSDPPQLYLHVDGGRTRWISEPETSAWRDRTDVSKPTGVAFEGMTPDGKSVFFVSDTPLLDGDTAPGPDLYRFTDSADPENDSNLTLITNNGGAVNTPGVWGGALVGMSDDARRVYVHDIGGFLELWEEGSVIRIVAPSVPRTLRPEDHLALTALPGNARVSPDGNWLAYINGGQMYVYSLRSDSVTCVSCPGDASLVPAVTNSGRLDYAGFRPRFLTDDGKVFFSSTGALVPEDTNDVADVYEYDGQTRTLSLLTSGKGRDPMMFADASASGNDVFVVTRQKLVSSDTDNYVDLYDVRVGAAPNEPATTAPACDGDGCQGALSGGPADDALGSLSLEADESGSFGHAGLTVKHRATFHGAGGVLGVKLGAVGRLTWSGRGLVSGSVRRGHAGAVKLRLRLDHSARTHLRSFGRYMTTVRLKFTAADGSTATRAVRVTFRAVAMKGR